MERQRYRELRASLRQAAKHHIEDARNTHTDATIVLVLIWAALHGRSPDWATKAPNWPGDLRPRAGLPSQSCVSRRTRKIGVLSLVQRLEDRLRDDLPRCEIKLVDGRPLPVGGCSKDPDAKRGYGAGQVVRGYKLHLMCDQGGAVDHWHLTPMNHSEPEAAALLIQHAEEAAYTLGDGVYDQNKLYDLAAERGIQWVALPRRGGAKAPGHRKHSPARLAVWSWVRSEAGGRMVRKARAAIERVNAWQGQACIGLNTLPHHVRRLHRVRLWVSLKITLYHHWLNNNIKTKKEGHA